MEFSLVQLAQCHDYVFNQKLLYDSPDKSHHCPMTINPLSFKQQLLSPQLSTSDPFN